ncbi:DUF2771 family protein [Nocardia sp. ET3-3]|uniref:DUF2771 family protein n=1 Tax=Nocardia terrae TaxID=2675851 RepID=A0A7K1UXR8_9NOCA|nr:DUF2771 family protein [Nocardia terrae]
MSQPRTRTIVAFAGAALLVFVAAVAAVVTIAVHRAAEPQARITAYANGKSITVAPYVDCNVRMQDCKTLPADSDVPLPPGLNCAAGGDGCHTGKSAELAVKPGLPLQLSLPKEISDGPWLGQTVYQAPNGKVLQKPIEHDDYTKGTTALTVPSVLYLTADGKLAEKKPAAPSVTLMLVGTEIALPILIRDQTTGEEGYLPHAAWSISTAA